MTSLIDSPASMSSSSSGPTYDNVAQCKEFPFILISFLSASQICQPRSKQRVWRSRNWRQDFEKAIVYDVSAQDCKLFIAIVFKLLKPLQSKHPELALKDYLLQSCFQVDGYKIPLIQKQCFERPYCNKLLLMTKNSCLGVCIRKSLEYCTILVQKLKILH